VTQPRDIEVVIDEIIDHIDYVLARTHDLEPLRDAVVSLRGRLKQ
jgi:hypothetical protein